MDNYYGQITEGLVITDIQYNDALDDVPTGKVTCVFAGGIAAARTAAPELGSSTELLPESSYNSLGTTVKICLVLKKRNFAAGKDGSTVVTLDYGFVEGDASTGAQPTSYQVTGNTGRTSILLHPRYAGIPESEKALANAILSGAKPYESVYVKDNEIKTKLTAEEKKAKNNAGWEQKTLENALNTVELSKLGAELIGKIQNGITEYLASGCEFVETSYSTAMQTGINHLGKITTPPAPAPSGGNWLLTGLEATKERGERRWKIKKTWKSADAGATWDNELYKN